MQTRFTELIGCRLPVQLAALGGVGTPELAEAVIAAGGLGMVPSHAALPASAKSHGGINFLLPYSPSAERIRERAREVRVVEFFFGDPDAALVKLAHDGGALVSWQVGSAQEARAAADAGCDLVVAQGVEAGGHVRGTTPLDDLLPAVLNAVDVPVVATGGIGSPERVAELMARGADAVRVGTRFLATPECDVHPLYVEALLHAHANDTVVTEHFDDDGAWPATVRVLKRSLDAAEQAGNHSTIPPTRRAGGDPLAMACYAGTSVAGVTEVKAPEDIVKELTAPLD